MFSLLCLRVFLFSLIPHPKRFWPFFVRINNSNGLLYKLLVGYGKFYESYEASVIKFHRAELSRLDWNFRMAEAGQELVRRRRIATENGIGPLDREYPDIEDVLKD